MNILFVCTGNTCRSIMAEIILREKIMDRFGENDLKSFRIESAGIMADESTYISSGDVIKIVQDIIKSAT